MIGELFHILVTGVGSVVVEKTLRLLVEAECPRCSERRRDLVVRNRATNEIHCLSCGTTTDQYTNVTPHTKRKNGGVLAARLGSPGWDPWGAQGGGAPFSPVCTVEVVEGGGEALVADLTLNRVSGAPFHVARIPVRTFGARHTQSLGWSISPAVFPHDIDSFSVGLRIMNEHGDELHRQNAQGTIVFKK